MISNVIVNEIAAADATLTKGTDLFAEQGRGVQHVVVKTTNTRQPYEEIADFRESSMQVLIGGWDAQAGYSKAEEILTTLEGLLGSYAYGDEQYVVKSLFIRNLPTPLRNAGQIAFSINFVILYTLTIN